MNNTDIKVDIVYLWVNGHDPVWRKRRQLSLDKLSNLHLDNLAPYSNVEGRFRDNDELRYSLRALERFYPDHGHIFIVTDAQIPLWLKATNQVTVVDHLDLIPAALLPTFDSGNIESYIHRIPGLSERYFYLNDDVFFGSPVNIDEWFWDDGIYVTWSDEPFVSDEPMRDDATSLENACRQSNHWFRSDASLNASSASNKMLIDVHYKHTFRTFAHSPRPMLKSILFELELVAPELFMGVRSTVFRTWNTPTIVSDFVMRWALATGRALVRDHSHLHVSTGTRGSFAELELLKSKVGKIDFFCINDTTDDAEFDDPRFENVRNAMELMFPLASTFEE
jgi:hypothetical protein